jgi:endonuclease YncB( thermonuclease family)
MLSGLKGWLSSNGNQLNCSAVGPRYRCVTPNGKDVAMVVLANGAAEVDAGAPPEYRNAQNQARMMHKGIWAQ